MIIAVVATAPTVGAARETVRAALAVDPTYRCEVLDLDGRYQPLGSERVSTPDAAGVDVDAIRLTLDESALLASSTALWSARLLDTGHPVMGLTPGVLLQSRPAWTPDVRVTVGVVRAVTPSRAVPAGSLLATELFVLGADAIEHRDELRRLAADWQTAERWLDLFVARVAHLIIADDAALVSSANSGPDTILSIEEGRFTRDDRAVVALDLVGMNPERPWLYDGRSEVTTGPLLSRNPALDALVQAVASRERPVAGAQAVARVDADIVRVAARAAEESGDGLERAFESFDDWMLELLPRDGRSPVARYLAGVRRSRSDLLHTFPRVPGPDSGRLAQWALDHGVLEARYDSALLRRAAELTLKAQPAPQRRGVRRPHGVNLIGYLSGALGIGTSARLLDAALEAARVPTSTFAASTGLQSRQGESYRRSGDTRYDVSLLAVNADQTAEVVEAMADVVAGTYRIGMWYWEVESFPRSRDAAFSHVDEIWVATDFIRDAIAARAAIPVRTVTPPLPQRSRIEPPEVPARLGIPQEKPWFFFAFDYLSTVERKNPLGLIEAFSRAFPVRDDRGPVLVIKTLNADRRIADAERVRLAAAARSDVILIDEYLEPDELTALMARCTAYVSLHRAEGLGLTVAEAMAWARPVVVSGYSGTMQFTSSRNAYLVPCGRTPIPVGAEPYPAGTPWGDPDLDQAAAFLRQIVDDPTTASERGSRAAEDMRVLHSPTAAAPRVKEALDAARRRQREMRRGELILAPRRAVRGVWSRLFR